MKRTCIIALCYFLLQLCVVFIWGYTSIGDADGYLKLAQQVISRGELYPAAENIYHPYIWNIGVINLWALLLYCFGSITSILIFNCFINTLTALFLYKLVEKISNEKIAFISFLFYVFSLNNLGQVTYALSELPFLFFLILGFYFSLFRKVPLLMLAGVFLALSNWTRPLVLFLIPALFFYLYKRNKMNSECFSIFIKTILSIVAGFLLSISVMGLDTYNRTGHFIFQSNTGWFNLMMTTWDGGNGGYTKEVFKKGNPGYIENENSLNYIERNTIWKERALDYSINHPFSMLRQVPNRLILFFFSDNISIRGFSPDKAANLDEQASLGSLKRDLPHWSFVQWLVFINQIYYYAIILFFVLGSILALKRRNIQMLLPFLIVFLGSIVTISVVAVNRYHQPITLFMIIIAAYYISERFYGKNKIV